MFAYSTSPSGRENVFRALTLFLLDIAVALVTMSFLLALARHIVAHKATNRKSTSNGPAFTQTVV
jgi:hypothetical protein